MRLHRHLRELPHSRGITVLVLRECEDATHHAFHLSVPAHASSSAPEHPPLRLV
jgi:hypothetical protein